MTKIIINIVMPKNRKIDRIVNFDLTINIASIRFFFSRVSKLLVIIIIRWNVIRWNVGFDTNCCINFSSYSNTSNGLYLIHIIFVRVKSALYWQRYQILSTCL